MVIIIASDCKFTLRVNCTPAERAEKEKESKHFHSHWTAGCNYATYSYNNTVNMCYHMTMCCYKIVNKVYMLS